MIECVSRDRHHKHKKHSHGTGKKHASAADNKTSHHKTITLDNIPDSLLPHRSLINFVDDRAKLLDEVFSIFSEEEISNMLPDILKGIKLDEVQKLCYEQLKAMEVITITQIIQSTGDSHGKVNSSSSSNEDDSKMSICSQQPVPCDQHQVPSDQYQPPHDQHQVPCDQHKGPCNQQPTCEAACDQRQTPCDQHQASCDQASCDQAPCDSSKQKDIAELSTEGNNKNLPAPKHSGLSDTNLFSEKLSTFGDEISTVDALSVPECSGISEDSIELLPATMADDIDRELTLCPSSSSQEDNSKPITVASVPVNNTSQTAVLNELHMRKRALQSQLKKQQLNKKLNEQRTKEELLLRQKALQSLLAANATRKTTK